MNSLIKRIITVSLAATLLLGTAACTADQGATTATTKATTLASSAPTTVKTLSGKIVASGSTSMTELMTALGESFSVINPGVTVEIQAGGSGAGIKNVSEGVTELGLSSRALKDTEQSLGLTENIICLDGIAVVVNPANKAANLTKDQLISIFTGVVKNWKDVGGADAPIVVILREAGSGTRDGFESFLGIAGKAVGSQEANETGIVKSSVAANANAIGYISAGKIDTTVKALSVDGIAPTSAAIKDGSYKMQRPFVVLTKGTESELVKAFLTYIMSAEGQKVVVSKGSVSEKY